VRGTPEREFMVKIGCCGFAVAREKYYKNFEVLEIQKVFYQFPRLETVLKWREEAPKGFEFTLKASQLITHLPTSPTYRKLGYSIPEKEKVEYGFFKPTDAVFEAWKRTLEIALLLESKIVIFQMPPSFHPTVENKKNMKKFFKKIKRQGLRLVWEPRGKWEVRDIRILCSELGLVHCVDPFKAEAVPGEFSYFRLHGMGGYNYRYTDRDLRKLKVKCEEKRELYCMFNNVYMFEDALRFKKMLAR